MRRLTSALAMSTILSTVAVPAMAGPTPPPGKNDLGGKDSGTGPIYLVNPCNGENVTGQIKFAVSVDVDDEGNQSDIDVTTKYESNALTGDQGGSYEFRATARASYDTMAEHYSLPMLLKIKGKLGSPSFSLLADMFVFVDDHQRPHNLPSSGYGAKCLP